MPAPQAQLMKQAARLKFASFGLTVPPNWRQPQGDDAEHFRQAFKPEELSTQPAVTPGAPLFRPASMNKYHTDAQKMHIAKYGEFIDGVCDAICGAWGQWQNLASMTGIIVNAITASLGQVIGPPITPFIMMQGPKSSPMQMKYLNAIANVIGPAWMAYTATIKIPALPIFPTFLMCPSPVAPPTSNVPVPVAALTQVTVSLTPALMKQQMVAQLADPRAPYHNELFESICEAFDQMFKAWQISTQVTNIMATGPVPSMALPVPVPGPVTGGIGSMPPGGFK
jgi:hypothetical protein